MTLYAIILTRPNEGAWAKVRSNWEDDHHIVDDRLAIVKEDSNTLTAIIAEKIGMDSRGDASGIVVQMDYFSGRTLSSLVEWINKARE